jgi:hypothetical protein
MLDVYREILDPYILRCHRSFEGQTKEKLGSLSVLPKVLEEITIEYLSTYDNVEELATNLGMVFPPHITTPGEETNYYWANLHSYNNTLVSQSNQSSISDPEDIEDYDSLSDTNLLNLVPMDDWYSRQELVENVTSVLQPKEESDYSDED